MLIDNRSTPKVFLYDNRWFIGQFTNSGGAPVTLAIGTVLGRITTGQKLKPFASDASDGSQQPIAVLADNYEVPAGATIKVHVCNGGLVDEGKLVFTKSGDTLDTAVDGTSVRDCLIRNTTIELVTSTDLTKHDNH